MKKYIFLVSLAAILYSCGNADKKNEVVFVSWGGSYQKAQDSAYLMGFQQKSGVRVRQESYSGELPKIKEMVGAKKTSWDVVSITQEMFSRGVADGLYEDLDFKLIDTAGFLPGSVYKQGIAHLIFSTVIAYNKDHYKDRPRPVNWKEFWDVKNFPGNRSLNDGPVGNLEFALLADGANPAALYPLDIDRAFRKLDEIRPYIKVWWKEGQQPVQLLSGNDVQLSTAYNGRVSKAQSDGEPVAIEWNGGMLEPEYFVIPKGAPNKQQANELIGFSTRAEQQQKFVRMIPYGPTNLGAMNALPDDVLKQLPDSKFNLAGQFLMNGVWWGQHYDELLKRWNEWKIGGK
jgi:putative spermidine/putrescine transport system substrate-binding protein